MYNNYFVDRTVDLIYYIGKKVTMLSVAQDKCNLF